MSDIVERLRSVTDLQRETERSSYEQDDQLALEAADTIAALRAEVERLSNANDTVWADNERLRAALKPFAKAADGFDTQRIKNPEEWFAYGGVSSNSGTVGAITVGDLRRARAALAEEKHDD